MQCPGNPASPNVGAPVIPNLQHSPQGAGGGVAAGTKRRPNAAPPALHAAGSRHNVYSPPQPSKSRRMALMEDFAPTQSPSTQHLIELLAADTSPLALRPSDPNMMRALADDVMSTFADSAALRTIGADKAA